MTDPELHGIALQALNMAKRDLRGGSFNFLIAAYHAGEGLHRMTKIEQMIIGKLGEGWLNSGHTKDVGFGLLQLATALRPPDAVVVVTCCNVFKPSEKFKALPAAEQEVHLEVMRTQGHDKHHEMVRAGLLTMVDALTATAQTAERVCLAVQEVGPDTKTKSHFFVQDEFGGRIKMYGNSLQEIVEMLTEAGLEIKDAPTE